MPRDAAPGEPSKCNAAEGRHPSTGDYSPRTPRCCRFLPRVIENNISACSPTWTWRGNFTNQGDGIPAGHVGERSGAADTYP